MDEGKVRSAGGRDCGASANGDPLSHSGGIPPGRGGPHGQCRSVAAEMPGRYRNCSEFARGGIGRVLLARDAVLDRDVALKELVGMGPAGTPITTTGDPADAGSSLVARFMQEARLTGQLQHPSIVPVYELGRREDGTLYYTMKFVRGCTLRDAIAQAGTLRKRLELLPHFLDLCQAVAYAHSRGVIHRDIKPANVMIGEFGETAVLDWGLAKVKGTKDYAALAQDGDEMGEGEGANGRLTQHGSRVGTPGYMSPEQARGDVDAVAEPADVYALGATLYHLVTGRCPFEGESASILARVRAGDYMPMRAASPAAPPELAAICDRAMSLDPEDRYPTGGELAREVQRFLAGGLIESYHYSPLDRLRRFVKRRWPLVATAAASLAILLGVGAASYVQVLRARNLEHAQRVAAESANRRLIWENYAATLGMVQQALRDEAYSTARELLYASPAGHRRWEWGHLLRQSSPELLSLRVDGPGGMPGGVLRRAVFSPDGRYILTDRSRAGVKSVFDLLAGNTIMKTGPCPGWSECTLFIPGDRLSLAVSAGTSAVRLMDPLTGGVREQFDTESGILRSIVTDAEGTQAAGYVVDALTGDRCIVLWDCATGARTGRFPLKPRSLEYYAETDWERSFDAPEEDGPPGKVLGFLDGGQRLVCADESLFVLDLETGQPGPSVRECMSSIAAFAPETGTAAVFESSLPFHLAVWDVRSRTRLSNVQEPVAVGSRLALSPDGKSLATVNGTEWTLWSAYTGERVMTRQGHTDEIRSIAFSPDSGCVITTDAREIKVWSASDPSGTAVTPFRAQDGRLASLHLSEDDAEAMPACAFDREPRRLAEAGPAGEITLWRVPEARSVLTWKAHANRVHWMKFSEDGLVLATAASDGAAKLWDTRTGSLIMSVRAEPGCGVRAAALTRGGDQVAVSLYPTRPGLQGPNEIRVLDVQSGEPVFTMPPRPESVPFLEFSRDGSRLVAGIERVDGAGGLVRTLDLATGSVDPVQFGGQAVPDEMFWVGGTDQALVLLETRQPALWDLAGHREVWQLRHLRARHMAVAPEGDRFAVASMGGKLTVHAAEDGRQLAVLGEGQGPLAFSADGRQLVCVRDQGHLAVFLSDDWGVADEAAAFQLRLRGLRDRLRLAL